MDPEVEAVKEAVTKKIGDRTHVAGDFLVVGDPEKPSTWDLPVKVGGKPDHDLMGGAWAALFATNGFRGKPYQGADKQQAKKKLRALYKSEGMKPPSMKEIAEIEATLKEYGYDGDYVYRPFGGATSFSDLEAAQRANEAAAKIQTYAYQFPTLAMNIISSSDVQDKPAAIEALAKEFSALVATALKTVNDPNADSGDTGDDDEMDEREKFKETLLIQAASFQEVEKPETVTEGEKPPTFAHLDIQPIRPGWGNEQDNHYYPADVLEKSRPRFVGAKMYETDHRPGDKNTRTWVSTIVEDLGISEKTGAPVVRVAIHDPNFAERVRNLNKLGLLDRLECSIVANGKAEPGFVQDGRRGKRVTEITEVFDVDWVTRAGAGGKALSLVEDATGGSNSMDPKTTLPDSGQSPVPPTTVPAQESAAAQPALIRENEAAAVQSQEAAPAALAAERVKALLGESTLPQPSQDRLAAGTYSTEEVLKQAISQEVDYVKALTGSGKPVGMGESATPAAPDSFTALEEAGKLKSKINEKFFHGAPN